MERRLSAILVADVVGYSRLMEMDEAGTLTALKARRKEVLEPLVARHHGRIFKVTGDGVLIEFASAVEAVRCAVELQNRMAAANQDLPEARCIVLRIGINLGDVVMEGGDRYGDAVNIAARLEDLAEPGGILVSGTTFDHARNKVGVSFEDLGTKTLRNIAEPVRVYRVAGTPHGPAAPPKDVVGGERSIAVLPFVNLSGDPEQEYFSDGITEDIITSLSKVSQLFVIARNSAFTYKGKAVKVQQIGAELGVRYMVEGSVRKAGRRVRITAQLIDAQSGGHLWAERFDRELTDIFAVQDEVTQEIVSALALKLPADEQRRVVHRGPEDIEAYDWFLRGREAFWRHTREANAEAQAMFTRAVALEPRFSRAFAFLSHTHSQNYVNGWTASPETSLQLCYEAARQAVVLDGTDSAARVALSSAHLWRREHEAAIAEAKAGIVFDPSYSLGHIMLGWALHYAGRHEEAIACYQKALRIDPHYPGVFLHFLAQAYFMLGRFEDAAAALRRRLLRDPESDISRVLLAACYGHLGCAEEGRAEWAKALEINPEYSLEHRRRVLPFKDATAFERVLDGLRKTGVAETWLTPGAS